MAKTVVIDEIHVTARVPSDLPAARGDEVHQVLASEDFLDRLRRAVRAAIQTFPELRVVRVSLTR